MKSTLGVAALAALVGLGGCSAPRAVAKRGTTPPSVAALSDSSGTWDWMFRSTDEQGDMRLEQEEWHLRQADGRVEGYYDRAVTLMSTDDRLFRCNQRLGFTKLTRVHVSGQVMGNKVLLREVRYEAKPGPCDDGNRQLVEYSGTLRGETLALRWGPEAGQTLVRRTQQVAAQPQNNVTFASFQQPQRGSQEVGVSQPVDGDWEWELRSIDAEGDERLEREVWHLRETADGIRGYYERTVKRERGAGVYACNKAAGYETTTRYDIVGQRFGDKVSLTEAEYKVSPSPCDNGQRRLDTYQGQLPDADSLVLSWGPGNQLLRRKK